MGILDLFGFGKKKEKLKAVLKGNPLIVDVRSQGEFKSGHVQHSKCIPLDQLKTQFVKLKSENRPVVFCCASGIRSGMAAKQAKTAGIESYNGGGWSSLDSLIKGL